MKGKKIDLLIFVSLIAVGMGIATYASFRTVEHVPQKEETIAKTTSLNPVESSPSVRDSIVSFGTQLLGTPYASGACSIDGFDCSGFVFYVFQHFKIQVPRSSIQFEAFGKEVPIENVQRGDILVFLSPTRNVIGHVGIVTNPKGMESDFIHSSSGKEMKVIISSLKQQGYARRFVKAVNPFTQSIK